MVDEVSGYRRKRVKASKKCLLTYRHLIVKQWLNGLKARKIGVLRINRPKRTIKFFLAAVKF